MIVIITLKKLREAAGLSQNDLARKTGYSPQFIQKIEQGKAKSLTLEAAAKFCQALGCKPGDLLEEGLTPQDPQKNKGEKKVVTKTAQERENLETRFKDTTTSKLRKINRRKVA